MSRFWDIRAPRPRPRPAPHRAAPSRRRNNVPAGFFIFIVIIIVIGIFYFGNGTTDLSSPQQSSYPTTKPTTESAKTSPKVTSEDPTPKTDLKPKNKEDLSIKLVNGSGQTEEGTVAQQILENEDFRGIKVENALNNYEASVVYYQAPQEKYATEITDLLTDYSFNIREFTQETDYDLIIVLGSK